MDYYQIGPILREFRIRHRISQEELCFGLYATVADQAYSTTAEAAVRQALYDYSLAPLLKLQSRQSI